MTKQLKFIKLTCVFTSKPVYVSADAISEIFAEDKGHTHVYCYGNESSLNVQETPEQIFELAGITTIERSGIRQCQEQKK